LIDKLPESFRTTGAFGLAPWQWVGIVLAVAIAFVLGSLLGKLTSALLKRLTAKTTFEWDDALAARLHAPASLAWGTLIAWAGASVLDLPPKLDHAADLATHIGFVVALFFGLLRSIVVGVSVVEGSAWALARPGARSLISVGGKGGRVLVFALGCITILSELGFPVASIVAGLGLGGLALGLAAQKSLENLFGGVSIAVDQPLRAGDFVRVDDATIGEVESVGLRSTRIRTLDRTLVSLPNGRVADSRIECYTVRDRIRLACTLGLVYSTTSEQMRTVIEGLETVLKDHPKIWPDNVVVRFSAFGASSLDIEIMAWFQTTNWGEFQGMREEVLLDFMGVVEKAGSSFAFPSRTLYLAQG